MLRKCGCEGCYYQGIDEDIKVLEEWLDDNKLCFKNLFGESLIIPRKREEAEKYYKQIKAVEHILERNKQFPENYVSKDRIREKIGELEIKPLQCGKTIINLEIRKVLEDLLEKDYE